VRELAAERSSRLVDLARAMPARGDHFNDVCHLSYKGAAVFAQHAAEALVEIDNGRR